MMKQDFDWSDIPEKEQTAYEKRLALVESLTDNSITETERKQIRKNYLQENGISERTICNYLKRYRHYGAAGLLFFQKKEPARRIQDEKLRNRILEMVHERPSRTVPKIRELLNETDLKEAVSRISNRTIYRFLAEQGLTEKQRYRMQTGQDRNIYRQFQAEHSLKLVQGDARDGIWLPDGKGGQYKTYLFGWVDDYSRKILFAQYYRDEKLPRMEDSFKKMILRWGIPDKVYLDNGSVYIAKQFSWILKEMGIKKVHHPAYCAWCKGKVEAVMKTFKRDFQAEAALAGFTTLDELNSALWAWIDVVYNQRIHTTTGEAPHKRYIEGLPDNHRRITDLEWFNNLFYTRETRTVTKYGRIKLHSNQYIVTGVSAGKVVEVRYDPFDLRHIYRFENGKAVETLKAASLKQTASANIPEEKNNSQRQVSQHAVNHFSALRKKHQQMLKTPVEYSRLKEKK
jgi:putative transposase